jgi:hypothetical protein
LYEEDIVVTPSEAGAAAGCGVEEGLGVEAGFGVPDCDGFLVGAGVPVGVIGSGVPVICGMMVAIGVGRKAVGVGIGIPIASGDGVWRTFAVGDAVTDSVSETTVPEGVGSIIAFSHPDRAIRTILISMTGRCFFIVFTSSLIALPPSSQVKYSSASLSINIQNPGFNMDWQIN